MKRGVITLVAMLMSAPAAFAQQPTTGGTTATAQDEMLDSRIATRIANDPALKADAVKVTVEGGVATLSGMVATRADRARAEKLAKIPGITRVDNKIVTREGATDKAKGTAGKVTDKTKEGASKAASKTKDGAEKVGDEVTDGWITTRIKTKFMGDEGLRASDIKVDTDNHVVTLSGTVATAAAHAKALEMARGVEGVNRVVDKLTLAK